MIKAKHHDELLQELSSIETDIQALLIRIKSPMKTAEQLMTNLKYLGEAFELRNTIYDTLETDYCHLITLEELMFDIQKND